MNDLPSILHINYSRSISNDASSKVGSIALQRRIDARINKLNEITQNVGLIVTPPIHLGGIREVYLKFMLDQSMRNDFRVKFSMRELRILSFSLNYKEDNKTSIFETPDYLANCLIRLESDWRDSYILGLLECLLINWKSEPRESVEFLSEFITEKLHQYSGTSSFAVSLKKNSDFLKANGDTALGIHLAGNNISILDVTSYLLVPNHWFSYAYFSGVILSYFSTIKIGFERTMHEMETALLKFSASERVESDLNKIVIGRLVLKHAVSHPDIQDEIKDLAFKIVGDPGTPAWNPYGNAEIEQARTVLNFWVTRQFITVFFETCINDPRRKSFWLQFSNKIRAFHVFGSAYAKRKLKSDPRISEYVDSRFKIVDTRQDVSAIMFELGDYKLIEFSDEGFAFYAYKNTNPKYPSLNSNSIRAIDVFIDGGMPVALTRRYEEIITEHDEGRLLHRDGNYRDGSIMRWEDVFEYWLKKYVP